MEQMMNTYNEQRRSAVAIGNFDGVHLGHQKVFLKTKEIAATENLFSVALTFTPHPKNFFDSSHPVKIITEDSYKRELILSLGIDTVYFQEFNHDFASMDCRNFVSYLKDKFNCFVIVCGEGFRFGNNAAYDTSDLDAECIRQGMRLEVVSADHEYSSSAVRTLIEEGKVKEASALLGRPYSFCSEVVTGIKLRKE